MHISSTLMEPRPRRSAASWSVVLLILAAAAGLFIQSRRQAERNLKEQAAQALTQAQGRERRARVLPVNPELGVQWAKLQQEIGFPWHDFFEVVEKAASADVELLEMIPEKQSRAMVLRGQAHDSQALLTFLSALARQRQTQDVVLLRRQAVEKAGLVTVEFEIRTMLKPGQL